MLCLQKIFFPSNVCAWKKPPSQRLPICNGTSLQEPAHLTSIFQVLHACLAVARMTVFLCAEYLQSAMHTFQSGLQAVYFEGQIHIEIANVHAHGCGHYLPVASQ